MPRHHDDKTERDINIHADVFAFGVALYPDDKKREMCRVAIEELHGMDYVPVPFSLANSLFQTLEVYIRRNLPYLKGDACKLIEFNRTVGVIKPTEFGAATIKKLAARIRARL